MNSTEVQALKQKIDRYEQLVKRGNELSSMLAKVNELPGPFTSDKQLVESIEIEFFGAARGVGLDGLSISAHAFGRFLTTQLNEQLCAVTKEMAEL